MEPPPPPTHTPHEQESYSGCSSLTSHSGQLPAPEPNRLLKRCHYQSRVGVASKIRALFLEPPLEKS